ncbi:Calx-beta domain-containing protein, partial [Rhodopirellula europaea]
TLAGGDPADLADAMAIAINTTTAITSGTYVATPGPGPNPTYVDVVYTHGGTDGTVQSLVFDITIEDDNVVEGSEDYRITLSNPGSTTGASVLLDTATPATEVITRIEDNDFSLTTLTTVSTPAETTEGGAGTNLKFTFTDLNDPGNPISHDEQVTVNFQLLGSNGVILTPGDYTIAPVSPAGLNPNSPPGNIVPGGELWRLLVPAGATEAEVVVTASADLLVEGTETLTVNIVSVSNASGQYSFSPDQTQRDPAPVTVDLLDANEAQWSIVSNETSNVTEDGTNNVATYTVSLSGMMQANENASVTLTVDFPSTGPSMSAAELADAMGIAISSVNPTATGTYSIGTVTPTTVELIYDHGGTDSLVEDLEFEITIFDDGLVEGPEDYRITLSDPASTTGLVVAPGLDPDLSIDPTNASVVTTIVDDDSTTWTLTDNNTGQQVGEGDSALYALALSGAAVQAGRTATIDLAWGLTSPTSSSDFAETLDAAVLDAIDNPTTGYNVGKTAGDPDTFEYNSTTGTVTYHGDGTTTAPTLNIDLNTFEDTGATQTVSGDVHPANYVEPDEDFTVAISNPGGTALPGVLAVANTITTTIIDDDSAEVTIVKEQDGSENPPGLGTTDGVFKVLLSNPSQTSVKVDFVDDPTGGSQTAKPAFDYNSLASTVVTFGPGQQEKFITINTKEDPLVEGPETVEVELIGFNAAPDPQITIGAMNSATLEIE